MDISHYLCVNGYGTWKQGKSHIGENQYICEGRRYSFDIINKTAYPISSAYFDQYRINDSSPDDSSSIDYASDVGPEGTFHTTPAYSNMIFDYDYGNEHNGYVGSLTVLGKITLPNGQQYIDGASIGAIKQSVGDPASTNVSSLGAEDLPKSPPKHMFASNTSNGVACLITPNGSSQYSDQEYHPGKSFLVPNFMEARIQFCVNYDSTSESPSSFEFYGANQTNLVQESIQNILLPSIGSSTYVNRSLNQFSESISFGSGEKGQHCSDMYLPLRTYGTRCTDLEDNASFWNY